MYQSIDISKSIYVYRWPGMLVKELLNFLIRRSSTFLIDLNFSLFLYNLFFIRFFFSLFISIYIGAKKWPNVKFILYIRYISGTLIFWELLKINALSINIDFYAHQLQL